MPRYYCDYCDTYLTHDSPSVRKQHNAGYKHKANVRSYYQQFEEQQTQSLIDQRVKEHLGQTAAFQQQVGAAFHQHLAALQSGQQRPRPPVPVLTPPSLPIPGSTQLLNNQPFVPTLRPPVLPRPNSAPPAYGVSMGAAPTLRPPGAPVTSSPGMAQSSGLPRPATLIPPVATGARPTATSSSMANGVMSPPSLSNAGMYQTQQPNSVPTSGSYGTYNYAAPATNYSQQSTSAGLPNPTYVSQQPPRVSSPPSSGNSDGYAYAQAPTSASGGN